jgi:hypothetical protein
MNRIDRFGLAQWMPAPQFNAPVPETHTMTQHDHDLIRDLRYVMHENQTQFWQRFGVTQTQGSRFERGRSIPLPVLLLIRLYLLRIIGDDHLHTVRAPEFGKPGAAAAGISPAGLSNPAVSP